MNKFIKDCFTTSDNSSWDIGRVLWTLSILTFLGCAVYAIYRGQAWDAMSYGTGIGLCLAGGGAALGLKSKTEPTIK